MSASKNRTSPTSARRWPAASEAAELLVDIDNLTVRLAVGEPAVSHVSLCVHRGEFVGLVGPNGAGKTTLLRAMLGLQAPSSGRVALGKGARLGYIPQRGQLYEGVVPVSVLEVVRLGSRGDAVKAHEALLAVSLQALSGRRFSELSGGQQQRVIIAKALAGDADVLVLDEPATGIDEASQATFYAMLQGLQAKGVTIIMVSHEVDTVLRLVTRVVCLNQTVLYDGPPQHFDADAHLPASFRHRHIALHHKKHKEGWHA